LGPVLHIPERLVSASEAGVCVCVCSQKRAVFLWCVCVQCRLLKKQACRACQGCKEAVPENKELMPHQVVMLTYLPHNNQPARSIPCYTSFAPPAKSHDLRCFACIMGNVGMRLGSFEKQALSFLDVCNSICTAQKHICR